MSSGAASKTTYRAFNKLDKFYTGGSICLTSNEEMIVCACGDEVKVVEVSTGLTKHSFAGDTEPITAIAVSPDGTQAYASSRSLTTKAWDLITGKCVRTWKAHTAPTIDMAVDASGGLLATASAAREVRVWDTTAGFCTHAFSGHAGIVLCVLFHPSDLTLVSSGDDGTVVLWDLVAKRSGGTLNGHVSAVTALAWGRGHSELLSAGRDRVVTLWDVTTKQKLRTFAVFESVETLVMLPEGLQLPGAGTAAAGALFATGGEAGQIKAWDAKTGACVYKGAKEAGSAHAREIVSLLAMPLRCALLRASADCHVAVLSAEGGVGADPGMHVQHRLLGNNDEITALCFAGHAAAPTAAAQRSVPEEDGVEAVPPPASLPPHIVLATNSDAIHVLSSATMGCEASLVGHVDTVLAVAVLYLPAPRDCWLVLSGSKDKTVRLWHLGTHKCVAVGKGHLSAVSAVAFGAKAAPVVLSAGLDKLIRGWNVSQLWDALEGDEVPEDALELGVSATVAGHDKAVNCIAVAPNNKLAATGSADRTAKLWQLPALSAPLTLRGHKRGVWGVCFAPIDRAVLTASGDATMRLWSIKDGAALKTFTGHSGGVLQATFITLGTQLASSGSDGLIKLWNVASGECVGTAEGHEDKAWALDVAGDGDAAMLSGGADGTLTLWADSTAADQEAAQSAVEERLRQQQDLDNALVDKNYLKAARLAFKLKQPGRLLAVVAKVVGAGVRDGPVSAHTTLKRLVCELSDDELGKTFAYLRDWNTSARHCHCAQALLHALLAQHHPQALARVGGILDVSEVLMLYTQRHFNRMDRLLQSTFLLDYLLTGLQVYTPEQDLTVTGADGASGGSEALYLTGIRGAAAGGAAAAHACEADDAAARVATSGDEDMDAAGAELEAGQVDGDSVLRRVVGYGRDAGEGVVVGTSGREESVAVLEVEDDVDDGGSLPGWGAGFGPHDREGSGSEEAAHGVGVLMAPSLELETAAAKTALGRGVGKKKRLLGSPAPAKKKLKKGSKVA